MFFVKVTYPNLTTSIIDADYYFELYRANINLTLKGTYKFELGLITNGGLNSNYYTTVDFKNKFLSSTDAQINFETDLDPLLTGYPADYYSVVWEGYLTPKTITERY